MGVAQVKSVQLEGLRVFVNDLIYHHDKSLLKESGKPHAFIYYITIRNLSDRTVVLKNRRWMITGPSRRTEIFDSPHIEGASRTLAQGESFSYNSYHMTDGDTRASGVFRGEDLDGTPIWVSIPEIVMEVPFADRQMELGI
ncbi:MAG: ApaG domain [Verrucomicrobiota bacterium]